MIQESNDNSILFEDCIDILKTYHKTGFIHTICEVLDGKKHGKELWYYENRQIEREINWLNGKKNGLEVHY